MTKRSWRHHGKCSPHVWSTPSGGANPFVSCIECGMRAPAKAVKR